MAVTPVKKDVKKALSGSRGFTILELIAVVVITALFSVVIFQIAANNTTRAYQPLARLDRSLALKEVMEEITADFHQLIKQDPAPLATLQGRLNSGYYWNTKPFSTTIQASSYCFTFTEDAGGNRQESATHNTICQATDRNIKVTISWGKQSLTALFSPYAGGN